MPARLATPGAAIYYISSDIEAGGHSWKYAALVFVAGREFSSDTTNTNGVEKRKLVNHSAVPSYSMFLIAPQGFRDFSLQPLLFCANLTIN